MGMLNDGTAIGDGLATSINRIKEGKAKSKSIILITDVAGTCVAEAGYYTLACSKLSEVESPGQLWSRIPAFYAWKVFNNPDIFRRVGQTYVLGNLASDHRRMKIRTFEMQP